MSDFNEYEDYDALGLAELVRNKEVTSEEVCEAAISRAEERNPKVNAINRPMFEEARATIKNLGDQAGPFAGVPFLVKDLGLHVAGVPLSNGSAALRDYIPTEDDTVITRYREAGLVFFGKTNTPEFGLMGVTEPEAFGPTRNPWNLGHTSGGSSGGAAAAVASGMTPVATASDGGGSIRIPASACGLFGLKPTRGRIPLGPSRGEGWDGAAVNHVVSRSVRDSAALLDATHGPAPGAPYQITHPGCSYLALLDEKPETLKIAFCTRSPLGTDVDPECIEAVEKTAELLQSLGHQVEEKEPEVDGLAVAKAYLTMYFGHVAADLRWIREVRGEDAIENVEQSSRLLGLIGEALPAGEFVHSKRTWNQLGRTMADFHTQYDLYMTPTVAYPPVKIGELAPGPAEQLLARGIVKLGSAKILLAIGLIDKIAKKNLSRTPFTQLANLTGQPAMSVPLHWTKSGLPIGVQFVAPFADEETLVRLAGQLEEAQPWFTRRPPLFA